MKLFFLFIFAVSVGADPVLKGQCRLNPHPSVEYRCIIPGSTAGSRKCSALEPARTIVNPLCRTSYYSPVPLTNMQCLHGNWDNIAKCAPDCGRVTADSMELVVGGQRVRKGQLPWHAGVYRKTTRPYEQICGGTLVSANIVISAAHCFWTNLEKQLPASRFAVAVGKLYRPWDNPVDEAQKSDVSNHSRSEGKPEQCGEWRGDHSLQQRKNHLNRTNQRADAHDQDDIAVLVATRDFQFNTYVRPVCLNFDFQFEVQQLYPGNQGKVAGWGLTAANGKPSSVLQVVDLPYVDIRTCINNSPPAFREYITSDKICAGTQQPNTALCKGDSGGGLVYSSSPMGVERFYLRGVVSTAPASDDACTTAAYTSFTKLSKHEQFIKQFSIESGEYRCDDGSSITAIRSCDGARDCADGSDETEDACSTQTCAEYLFRCAYGACVDRGAKCNGNSNILYLLISRPESVSCILPPYPEHGAYATDIAGAEPGQVYERVSLSNITCERGYAAQGSTSREFSCSHGVWTGSVPRCVLKRYNVFGAPVAPDPKTCRYTVEGGYLSDFLDMVSL
ncbi:Hemolymph protein 14 [Operophtera brumata]|uniref:Hemolymph protein 14 n=1 Tax=Operophtera brumata TaxID=104452 RepID=A0A0L7LQT9_OPEBR|nr:Hemolymph protein 14 [Operophtera brumata]